MLTPASLAVRHAFTKAGERMKLNSPCKLSSDGERTKCKILTSSAYLMKHELEKTGFNSSTTMVNKRGPRTLPWGTPLEIKLQEEKRPFHKTRCCRQRKKSFSQHKMLQGMSKREAAQRMTSCKTLSNALEKSNVRTRTAPEAESRNSNTR